MYFAANQLASLKIFPKAIGVHMALILSPGKKPSAFLSACHFLQHILNNKTGFINSLNGICAIGMIISLPDS
jgi:hypothetical protein